MFTVTLVEEPIWLIYTKRECCDRSIMDGRCTFLNRKRVLRYRFKVQKKLTKET